MTGIEVKKKVHRYLENKFDNELILDGIQEMISWLGEMGYIEGTIDIKAEPNNFYQLPEDIIKIDKVEIPEENAYYEDYLIDGMKIRFEDENNYKIFAKRLPIIENIEDDLTLHRMLENSVVKYVKGFCKMQVNDQSQDGARLQQEAKKDAVKSYRMLKKNQSPLKSFKVIREA